ncbi:unnamed protein product [Camellia sinensis]
MEKSVVTFDKGTICSSWNYSPVAAYSNGHVKVYELLDPLELKNWVEGDHQRWLPVDELALPEDKGDPVYAVAWAPNIGSFRGKLCISEVWQTEWDMSGMTLATTGSKGAVRLWQSNLNGIWHEQAAFEPTT